VGRTSFAAAAGVVSLKSNQPGLNAQPKTSLRVCGAVSWSCELLELQALTEAGKPAVSRWFDMEKKIYAGAYAARE